MAREEALAVSRVSSVKEVLTLRDDPNVRDEDSSPNSCVYDDDDSPVEEDPIRRREPPAWYLNTFMYADPDREAGLTRGIPHSTLTDTYINRGNPPSWELPSFMYSMPNAIFFLYRALTWQPSDKRSPRRSYHSTPRQWRARELHVHRKGGADYKGQIRVTNMQVPYRVCCGMLDLGSRPASP
jgi:hypothetical protein